MRRKRDASLEKDARVVTTINGAVEGGNGLGRLTCSAWDVPEEEDDHEGRNNLPEEVGREEESLNRDCLGLENFEWKGKEMRDIFREGLRGRNAAKLSWAFMV